MTENKTVEEFWGPGSKRDKLIDFYRAIKSRDSYVTPADDSQLTEVSNLAKDLIEYYDAAPAQLKTMLESAEWAPEAIAKVLCE